MHRLRNVLLPDHEEGPAHYIGAVVAVRPRLWRHAQVVHGSRDRIEYPSYAVLGALQIKWIDVAWNWPDVPTRKMPSERIDTRRMTPAQIEALFEYPTRCVENDAFNVGDPVLVRPSSPYAPAVKQLFDSMVRAPRGRGQKGRFFRWPLCLPRGLL